MQIILNADDFGKSPGRNLAVDDSFKQGFITSAGLIVTGKYSSEAVELAEAGGYVPNLHLHFNLSANQLQEGSEDSPLTEAMQRDSFFCKNGRFKQNDGLPRKFSSIRKWRLVYRELAAQYERFNSLTKGQGDSNHVDFHLWYNLSWPVAVALGLFTRRYGIKSVRYIGAHQEISSWFKMFRYISWDPHVKMVPATNIDFFLSKRDRFSRCPVIELYCHPHYKDGVFLDDSPSYLKHARQPMPVQLQSLRESEKGFLPIAWKDVVL